MDLVQVFSSWIVWHDWCFLGDIVSDFLDDGSGHFGPIPWLVIANIDAYARLGGFQMWTFFGFRLDMQDPESLAVPMGCTCRT